MIHKSLSNAALTEAGGVYPHLLRRWAILISDNIRKNINLISFLVQVPRKTDHTGYSGSKITKLPNTFNLISYRNI